MGRLQGSRRDILRFGSLGIAISCLFFTISNWKVQWCCTKFTVKYILYNFGWILALQILIFLAENWFASQSCVTSWLLYSRQCNMLPLKQFGISCLVLPSHPWSRKKVMNPFYAVIDFHHFLYFPISYVMAFVGAIYNMNIKDYWI